MRLMEGLRLRVKDIDFDRHVIIVREAKGNKDRVVMLPRSLAQALRAQVVTARLQWDVDRKAQRGGVETPHALEAKYPQVGRSWGWFWVFPSPTLSVDPRSGVERRHHLFEERLQRAIKRAVGQAGICKPVSVHTLRHSFATHLLQKRAAALFYLKTPTQQSQFRIKWSNALSAALEPSLAAITICL